MFLNRIFMTLVLRRNISAISWYPHAGIEKKLEKYGGKYNLTMILGSGKSREQMKALQDIFLCLGAPLDWETITEHFENEEEFDNMLLAIKRNRLAIKGNLDKESAVNEKFLPYLSKNMAVRRSLDLHSFVTEFKSFESLSSNMRVHKYIDVVVVRQNTEGDNMMLEHSLNNKTVEHLRVITLNNSERLAEVAFNYAEKMNRKKVQCLHRRHVLPLSEEVFIKGFLTAAGRYPHIKYEIKEIEKAFHAFMKDTNALDVVVTNSLDGIKMKSVFCGMLGSSALVAGSNIGKDNIVFEPASRPKDGSELENPTPYFLSGALLLDYLELNKYAETIRESLEDVFKDKVLPPDLGGNADLHAFTKAVIDKIQKKMPYIQCPYIQKQTKTCKNEPTKPA